MIESQFAGALDAFIEQPCAQSAFNLIKSCQKMIVSIARGWHHQNLPLADKIREIMSEMLLILLEDFSAAKVKHPHAILAFLQMKIRRLTRPNRRLEFAFGGADDMAELGRCNFSAMRLQLAEEIYQTVRRCLLCCADQKVAILEFLFIHVYPELVWVSRMLAQKEGTDLTTQINADKKRHSRFNTVLRQELKQLTNGDLAEIGDWTGGERSHLAWRIINITPCEIGQEEYDSLQALEQWRESIDRRQPQLLNHLDIASRVHRSMKKNYTAIKLKTIAAEEAEPYGEEPDLLRKLIGSYSDQDMVREDHDEWKIKESDICDQAAEDLFTRIASEVSNWLDQLVTEKKSVALPKQSKNQW